MHATPRVRARPSPYGQPPALGHVLQRVRVQVVRRHRERARHVRRTAARRESVRRPRPCALPTPAPTHARKSARSVSGVSNSSHSSVSSDNSSRVRAGPPRSPSWCACGCWMRFALSTSFSSRATSSLSFSTCSDSVRAPCESRKPASAQAGGEGGGRGRQDISPLGAWPSQSRAGTPPRTASPAGAAAASGEQGAGTRPPGVA